MPTRNMCNSKCMPVSQGVPIRFFWQSSNHTFCTDMASSDSRGRHWSGSEWNHWHAGHSAIDAWYGDSLVALPSTRSMAPSSIIERVIIRSLINVVWEWQISKWRWRGMRNTSAGCKTGVKRSWKMIQKNCSFVIRHVVLAGRWLQCQLLPIVIIRCNLRDMAMLLRGGLACLIFSVWRRCIDVYLWGKILQLHVKI